MLLDHVNIHARDQEALRDFLIAVLGLQTGWRPGFDVPGYWLYLDGRPVIHTWPRTSAPGAGWVDHIAFGPCGDPATKRAELVALGLPFAETRLVDTDIVQFFITGPEGIKLELQCRPPPVGE